MAVQEKEKSAIEKAGEDLFNFAVDREDIKAFMALLPEEADVHRPAVEYELQLLKIIIIGWTLSYYLTDNPVKTPLQEFYWQAVQGFSWSLSETTNLMLGQDIDYFQTVKDRLDMYVAAMSKKPDAPEPAVVIGPEFARSCGNSDDIFTVMTGARMCVSAIASVRGYLEANELNCS